ncbi:RidA family protein [Roseomonas sp. NAR14]|uniref:RidA family protein n=1 Tax=Roseomonas acroporae TaxID=2937791 RepID=A0A9X1Y795_9PROT|nr:RidA family protein [Roseomonas acroporae]MCK8784806.1 RidA family protein [Roseomonas acroporae]
MTTLERIRVPGHFKVSAPITPAVRAGNLLFVSGIPAYDAEGRLAIGDFPAQMRQVMRNVGEILAEAGTGWEHVAKVNILLTRREDFEEMNRIYAAHFPDGQYPARTTAIVYSLPRANFLLEIECTAVIP